MKVASRICECYHIDYEGRGMPKQRGKFNRNREVWTKEVAALKRDIPGEKGVKQLHHCQESQVRNDRTRSREEEQ